MRYVYAVIAGLAIVAGITVWWMLSVMNHTVGGSSTPIVFSVEKGEQLRHVATRLESERLISSAGAWTLYALSTGQRSSILAGSYTLNAKMTGRDILHVLTINPLKDSEANVTIHEGQSLTEVASLLERADVVNGQEFLNLAQHPATAGFNVSAFRIAKQKPAGVDFEGYIFPDTYRFFKHSTPTDVLDKFLLNLDRRFTADLEQAASAAGHTSHDILTMASILEKEGKNTNDWGMISDLFWRRMSNGMPLQSDATVNYATGKSNQANTSIEDTKAVSPYNTYQNKGLPLGPIDNPGLETIRAAIYPIANTYVYFLTYKDKAVFATTYEQHLANKAKYLQ